MKKLLTLFTALILFGSMSFVQAVTYTPAGTPATVFGEEWNPSLTANDMVLSNGLYVFAKKSNFSQTSISFKVCKDHGWGTAYPGSNYGFTIPNGAKYLIITYNTSGNEVNAFAISSMTVAGDNGTLFGDTWTPSATANDMTMQNDGTYKFEKSGVALSAGSINFKACANHGWDNAWPGNNYELSIPESGNYTITITFDPKTLSVSASADLEEAVVVIPNIQLHSNIQNPSWAPTANFDIAGNNETASLTLTSVTKGNYEFGVKIDGTWTSNGAAFSRENPSHAITAGSSGNCTFNADRNGDYTFTWTYATNTLAVTYPVIPAQSVSFNSLASEILNGSVINLANCVESSGIDEPTYRFYIKEKEGEYGDAINANYNFNANGEYVVKVEALEYGEPVADDESEVVVYQSYTFTNGSTIYVDFTAVSGDVKGVNYPKVDQVGMDWDATGAGTVKAVTFTTNVTWTTMAESFIKTEKNGWANQPFIVPGTGKNCVVVAADGASYTWGTYTPIKLHGNFSGEWLNTDVFAIASNKETASLTLTNVAPGDYQFGVRIGSDDNWTSNGSAFTRANNSHAIAAGQGNCTFNADRQGDYTFTWTYATNTLEIGYPAEPDAFVAGSATEIFGSPAWDPAIAANKMTWDGELGKFKKVYTVDKAYKSVGLKVVYDGSWYGVEGGEDNVKFSLSGAGSFTVLFDKTNHHVTLDGEIVGEEQFDFEYAAVAANGEGNWAHGESWNAATTTNRMTEVAPSVWEISFNNVPAKECQFKFCFDGTWDHEFGGTFAAFGAEGAAVYGNTSSSINFTSVAGSEITIRLDMSNFNFATKEGATFTVLQLEPIAEIGGKFIINAKGDTAVFSRGNLQYNYGADKWSVAEHQYDFLGEEPNLQFGREGYTGSIDLFGWSSSESNYGRMLSNKDADYMNSTFVDWGGLFSGEKTWSTFSTSQMQYVIAHQKWTALVLDPTPENADSGDEIYGLAMFPYDWVMPAGFEGLHYSLHDWNDEQGFADNTIALSAWSTLEAAGAVFMPMAGARAGYWGNTWNGDVETTVSNPNASGYDWVDNIGWYGYYWLSTPDSRNNYKHCANYLIFLGWGEGPTLADDDDIYYPPQVWSREKRRGNSVRLVNIIPRQYGVTYTAGEGEGTVPVDENKYLDGAAITLAEATGLSKEGYRFAGWKFKGQVYEGSYTVNNVLANEEIVFEAQWEKDWQTVRDGLTAGNYYTVCYDKKMNEIKGASLWSFIGKDANMAYIEQAAAPYAAGTPYLIYAESETLEAILEVVDNPQAGSNNGLYGTFSYLGAADLDGKGATHILKNNELRPLGNNNHLDAYRAYVILNDIQGGEPAPAPGRRVRAIPMQTNGATGFENIEASEKPMKLMIDGKIYILRGEKMYDATGRMVK